MGCRWLGETRKRGHNEYRQLLYAPVFVPSAPMRQPVSPAWLDPEGRCGQRHGHGPALALLPRPQNQPLVFSVTCRRSPSIASRSVFAMIVLSPISGRLGPSPPSNEEIPCGISRGSLSPRSAARPGTIRCTAGGR
jgi:hypothetical protein